LANCFGRKGIYHKIFFPFQKIVSPFAKISPKKFMDAAWCKAPQVSTGNHRRKVKNKGGHFGESNA
jgi:hypothetical protein